MKRPLSAARLAAYERLRVSGHYSRAGKKGGKNKVAKYGREHMSAIGRVGGLVTKPLFKRITAVTDGKGESKRRT